MRKITIILGTTISFLLAINSCTLTVQPDNKNTKIPSTTPSKTPVKTEDLSKRVLDGMSIDLTGNKVSLSGSIVDSATGKIIDKKVTLSIQGNDKDKVEKETFSFDSGKIIFPLKNNIKIDNKTPINITVVAEVEGYFSSSSEMRIISPKTTSFQIKLVNMSNPPQGVTVLENKDVNMINDGIDKDLSLNLNDGYSKTKSLINLPKSSVLYDKNGQPLSGNIKANVGYFSNQSPNSLLSFPGGLGNATVNDKNGYFATGGFTSIELTDDSGKKAAKFDKPMDITMQIPSGTINPETGKAVNVGDSIGIWSYEASTGKWSSEGTGKVLDKDSNGNMNVSYKVNHLSYWNLDWFSSAKCNPKLRLIWDSDNHIPVKVTSGFSGQYYEHTGILKDEINDLSNVPVDREVTFKAVVGDKEVGITKVTLGASCPEIKLNINTANLPTAREIPVNVSIKTKTSFSKDEIKSLMNDFNIPEDQQKIVLDYTHPNGSIQNFEITQSGVDELKKRGVKNIDLIYSSFINQKIRPTAYMYDFTFNPYSSNLANLVDGKSSIRAFDGESHMLWISFFYKNNYYNIQRNITIANDTREINIDQEDTQITIEILKDLVGDYLNKK